MNIGLSAARRFAAAIIAIPLAGLVAMNANGGGYLSIVGPAPLRFETVAAYMRSFPMPALAMDNSRPAMSAVDTSLSLTNSTPPLQTGSTSATTNNAAATILSAQSQEPLAVPQEAFDAMFSDSPTAVAPVVTPQMLVEYFRPTPGTTNGVGITVVVPGDVGFTPPGTRPSSQAIYKAE